MFIIVTVILLVTLPNPQPPVATPAPPSTLPATSAPTPVLGSTTAALTAAAASTPPTAAPTATNIPWALPSPVGQLQPISDDPEEPRLVAEVNTDPNDADARRALAAFYADRQNQGSKFLEKAIEQYTAVVWLAPDDVASAQVLSDLYAAAHQADTALAILQWSAQHAGIQDKAPAFNKLGRAYHDRGQYRDAVAAFQTAVDANPAFVESWYRMGEAYRLLPDVAAARDAYQKCLKYVPADPRNQSWAGKCQDGLNQLPAP